MTKHNPAHEPYLSDAARSENYRDIELQGLTKRLQPGTRVRYSSVANYTNPDWGQKGTITALSPTGIATVDWDDGEPSHIDGRILHTD